MSGTEGTKVDPTERVIETRIAIDTGRGKEIGTGTGIGIGNGIETERGTAIAIETKIGDEKGIEIGIEIRTGEDGIAADPAPTQEPLVGRGAHLTPDQCLLTVTEQDLDLVLDQDPGLAPRRGSLNAISAEALHQVPIDRLVRSHQGMDARTEQPSQGGILFLTVP